MYYKVRYTGLLYGDKEEKVEKEETLKVRHRVALRNSTQFNTVWVRLYRKLKKEYPNKKRYKLLISDMKELPDDKNLSA